MLDFDWLLEIFESNSDKARLITIVISAIIAISIFLLTQYFINKRKRKELLIQKIEELYKTALEYEKHTLILYKDINKQKSTKADFHNRYNDDYYPHELINNMNNEVQNLQMLIGLYFTDIKFDKDKFYAATTLPILEVRIKRKLLSEDKSLELHESSKDNITNNVDNIKDICYQLLKKHSF